ncbi:Thioredoxin domain-containing protein [Citrus sinensis]|nr:Thioredoxin domain-containing protein [Citrus sinensis]
MATVATAGARALAVPRRAFLATRTKQISFLSTSLKMGFNLLQLRSTAPATARKNLIIRAARIESQGVSLGFRAPHFELPEPLTGKMWKLEDFESYPALLKGLAVVAISSNSVATHPQDGPEFMAEEAKLFNYPFPYLYDESQDVARDFGAACTPEFFLFKKDGRRPFQLVYHGQFDDSRPSNNLPVTGRDIRLAIECVLSGQPVSSNQKPR